MWLALARWFTADALKSLFWGIAGTSIFAALVWLYHDIKGGATAQANLQCLQANTEANEQTSQHLDTVNRAAEAAAQVIRDRRRNDGGKAVANALEIERQIKALPDDPVCFPKPLAKAMAQ